MYSFSDYFFRKKYMIFNNYYYNISELYLTTNLNFVLYKKLLILFSLIDKFSD